MTLYFSNIYFYIILTEFLAYSGEMSLSVIIFSCMETVSRFIEELETLIEGFLEMVEGALI